MAKAQDDGAEVQPIALPYEMELVEIKIKDKKFVKIMQGKEPSQVCLSFIFVFPHKLGQKMNKAIRIAIIRVHPLL